MNKQGEKYASSIRAILSRRLFSRPTDLSRFRDIVKWWELRRIPYNLIVGTTGAITCLITICAAGIASEKFKEPLGLPPPFFLFMEAVLFGIGANLCYTGGWVIEWFVTWIWRERKGAFGEISFFIGLLFSVALAIAPSVVVFGLLFLRMLMAR